jgi:two-component system, OmpR family, phosphate regulon sensor histidine kinase PhoR
MSASPHTSPSTSTDLAFLDALSEAVVLLRGNRVWAINSACAQLLQIEAAKAVGRSAIEVLRHHRLEHLALHGGTLELELAGRLIVARGVPGALLLWDITETKQREQEVREVMAVLSHEFRTPVAAIKSILEALALEPPPAQRQRFLQIAGSETERLVRLVEDLTVGFRPQAERRFALGEALERVMNLCGQELSQRQQRLSSQGGEGLVYCDPDKLVQVLLNLIENAMRHGPSPGRIQVVAQHHQQQVRVVVRDQGAPLVNYQHLFEAHRRGSGVSSPGSGMGLYIVRLMVKAWGGEVWAQGHGEQDGEFSGNEFGFTVPAAP